MLKITFDTIANIKSLQSVIIQCVLGNLILLDKNEGLASINFSMNFYIFNN